jgi:Eco57I restriction-modification methylase
MPCVRLKRRRNKTVGRVGRLAKQRPKPKASPGAPRADHGRRNKPKRRGRVSAGDQARFLARCQVDTPPEVVALAWRVAHLYQERFRLVGDLGCGDGRFAQSGTFDRYVGFEIDASRATSRASRPGVSVAIELGCAFQKATRQRFNLCIGNPPYARHHDIAAAWRTSAERVLAGLMPPYLGDGRANAYVYFIWLALGLTLTNGLVVLLLPHDWMTRPASRNLRAYIASQGWTVDIYLLRDATFGRVLTTSSICVINKAETTGRWRYFEISPGLPARPVKQPTRSRWRVLAYERATAGARAQRGLSPGTQKVLLLTEGQRVRYGLEPGRDVVAAVSTFRHLSSNQKTLSERLFREQFVNRGRRCWLIGQPDQPSTALSSYLAQVPATQRATATCRNRDLWWRFQMPKIPQLLYASGFVTEGPKVFLNKVGAVHVGGIHGIFCQSAARAKAIAAALRTSRFAPRVVALSKGFRKVEVHQMNALLNGLAKSSKDSRRGG